MSQAAPGANEYDYDTKNISPHRLGELANAHQHHAFLDHDTGTGNGNLKLELSDDEKTGDLSSETQVREVSEHIVNGQTITVGEAPPEVRAVVPESDDVDEACESMRAYVIGTIVCVVACAVNTWFGARQPGIYLSPFLAQVVTQPLGVFCAKVLPNARFTLFKQNISLNPGPWTVKEHCLVTLMATVCLPTATGLEMIVAIRMPRFFNDRTLGDNLGFQFLMVLGTQFLGLGLAGLARDYVVFPSAMIWPINLAKVTLFNALHRRTVDEHGVVSTVEQHGLGSGQKDPPVHGWTISMFRFCLVVIAASFGWYWITGLILPFLTFFDWPVWIAPTNTKLAIVMGTITGFGINPLPTFDWTYVSGAGLTPLITPFWATMNTFAGCIIGTVCAIAMYFGNTWYSAYMLPNSTSPFDRFGLPYNSSAVLTPEKTLDPEAYKAYSPLYYSAGTNVVYGAYFANYSAIIVYALLNHWGQLKTGFAASGRQWRALIHRRPVAEEMAVREDLDIHYVLMRKYKEVPQWWFVTVAVVAMVFGIISSEIYHIGLPVWGLFVCLLLALVFLIPSMIVMALSNIQIGLVVLAEIIPGVALVGRPYANMAFKMYAWVALGMAQLYVQDQKLAHYLHVPPRATFRAQFWGVLVSALVSLGTLNWQFKAVPDLCEIGQKDLLTCPYYQTFYASAILFGVVGPERQYGKDGLYKNLMWCFFIGAGMCVVVWAVQRRFKHAIIQSIRVPVLITGAMYLAPYNISFIWAGVPLAWFFMHHVYTRYNAWFNKYNYLLSIGMTVGVAFAAVLVFFCVTYTGARIPTWWGNTGTYANCDAVGCVLKPLPEKGFFGPGPGEFA